MYDILLYVSAFLLLPAIIYSIYVSFKVNGVYRQYAQIHAQSGMTAYEVPRRMLKNAGLSDVKIDRVRGSLTDRYNPKNNTIFLSDSVFSSTSVAAIGVAAHETGHAIQYNTNYLPVKLRTSMVPIVNISSRLSIPLIILGLILGLTSELGMYIIYIGIAFYAFSAIFMLVTLPVEFNASRRAKKILVETNILTESEAAMASKVLNVAAQTYVASFVVSLLFLLRLFAIFGRRR